MESMGTEHDPDRLKSVTSNWIVFACGGLNICAPRNMITAIGNDLQITICLNMILEM